MVWSLLQHIYDAFRTARICQIIFKVSQNFPPSIFVFLPPWSWHGHFCIAYRTTRSRFRWSQTWQKKIEWQLAIAWLNHPYTGYLQPAWYLQWSFSRNIRDGWITTLVKYGKITIFHNIRFSDNSCLFHITEKMPLKVVRWLFKSIQVVLAYP